MLPASATAPVPEEVPAVVESPDAPEPTDAPAAAAEQGAVASEAARSLTLDEAIATALAQNPDLVALREDVPVSRAAWEAARVYPYNPSVTVNVDPLAEEFDGNQLSVKNAVSVVQTFELAHQTRHRGRAAAANLTRTKWGLTSAKVQVVAETERRYFKTIYQRELYDYARSLAELDERLLEVLKRRFQAGQSTAADVSLARIEARTAQQQARLAATAWDESRSALARHLGVSTGNFVEPQGKLSQWRATSPPGQHRGDSDTRFDLAELDHEGTPELIAENFDALVDRRPDVQAALADLQAARAQWQLARASRVPNVSFGPTYERDESRTLFVGLEVQLEVPVVDSGRAKVNECETAVRQKQVVLRQLQLKARLEMETAWERYRRACGMVEEFRGEAADGLDGEIRTVMDLFTAGETDLLTVYAVRSKVVQAQKDYLDALNELTQAAAELTAVTTIPYTDLLALNRQAPQP